MKKLIMLSVCLILIVCFSSCTGDNDMSKVNDAYESMSIAIEDGDYEAALEFYNNGAADSGAENAVAMYYHARAIQDYDKKGCLGYPFDLIAEKSGGLCVSSDLWEEIQSHTKKFDGSYQKGSYYYIYISDGKIAIGDSAQLTGLTYCSGELVCIDGEYYWATHNSDGDDALIYKVEKNDSGIKLSAVDESNKTYSGEYVNFSCEMPELKY